MAAHTPTVGVTLTIEKAGALRWFLRERQRGALVVFVFSGPHPADRRLQSRLSSMLTCPLCENQQRSGAECEVCGRTLNPDGHGPEAAIETQRLEGLEATSLAPGEDVPVERLSAIELTCLPSGPAEVQPLAELDSHHFAPVPAENQWSGAMELLEERAPFVGTPVPRPSGPITCRYCRSVQAAGVICDRCGLRLPLPSAAPQSALPSGAGVANRCRSCGALGLSLTRCSECGSEIPVP